MAAAPDLRRATAIERQPTAPEARTTESMYEQYAGQILGYCMNQLGNREEAEDAVQSTFMNAFRGLQRGIVPEAESAWLFKIAHNVCLSRRRAAFRRGRVEFANDLETLQEIMPSPVVRETDDLIRLNDVLATMPENQRKAILLREWQGLSYHEIGREMELSQSAVETLIFRARRSLAAGLEAAQPSKGIQRLRQGSNLGTAFVALKSLLAGSAAVVAAGSVAGGGSLGVVEPQHFGHSPAPLTAASHARAHAMKPVGSARRGIRATLTGPGRNDPARRLLVVPSSPGPATGANASHRTRVARPAAAPPVMPVPAVAPSEPPLAPPEPPKQPEERGAAAPAAPAPTAEPERTHEEEETGPPPPPPPASEDDGHRGKDEKAKDERKESDKGRDDGEGKSGGGNERGKNEKADKDRSGRDG